MSSPDFEKHIAGAREALRAFLETLLGQEILLQAEAPVATSRNAAQEAGASLFTLLARGDVAFAVQLDPKWLPLLSKAMLGEPIEVGDEGYEDLARELAGQGYGAVRNQLSGTGVTLGEVSFEVLPPGAPLPEDTLDEALSAVAFHLELAGDTLKGTVLLPAPARQPAAAAAAGAPAPAPSPAETPSQGQPVPISPLNFPDLGKETLGENNHTFGLLADVELEVTVELGRRRLPLADILRLTNGSVIELEKLVGEPLDIYANGRFIAEGEAVVIDEQFGIRITSLASTRNRDKVFH